jgi:Flp pilus assembly protein TadD
MLPPAPMPATKNESAAGRGKRKPNSSPPPRRHFLFSLPIFPARLTFWLPAMLAVFLAGCAPSGPRALVQGKKYLDRGDYAAAVDALHTATTLLATNAVAWNDYGVALQHAGRLADAVLAYQNAIKFDRDLTEAHYNLGCLWLALNKPDAARAEFTAYTLRRNNSPDGWLQLGRAQLRAGDVLAAEKSFSTVLYLRPNDPEALNGLGLARVQRGRPREAAQFFAAAVRARPDFAPLFARRTGGIAKLSRVSGAHPPPGELGRRERAGAGFAAGARVRGGQSLAHRRVPPRRRANRCFPTANKKSASGGNAAGRNSCRAVAHHGAQ